MSKLGIGVMGCASIALKSTIPAIIKSDNYKLIGVASRTKEKAKHFATIFGCKAYNNYDLILLDNDIQMIYMPLPTGMHEEWIIKCLRHKKHVHAEKSLAINYDSAKRIIAVANEENKLVTENFMFKHHKQHDFVKNIISSGEIGKIRNFRSSFGFPPFKDPSNFRYSKKLGGGSILDAGAYTVKAAQMILGQNLNVLSSVLNMDPKNEVDVYGSATLVNEKSQVAQLSFGFSNFYQCNYEIWGSKGRLIAHKAFTPGINYKPRISIEKQDIIKSYEIQPDNHFLNILDNVFDLIHSSDYELNHKQLLNQSRILTEIQQKRN